MSLSIDPIQTASIIGAVLILLAYVSHQLGRMRPNGALYNVLNLLGSVLLAYVAVVGRQVGFILLEGVWTVISVYALWRASRES